MVKANDKYRDKLPFPLVAVYPAEGTFWEDHPSGVVDADWVTPQQKVLARLSARMPSEAVVSRVPQSKRILFMIRMPTWRKS